MVTIADTISLLRLMRDASASASNFSLISAGSPTLIETVPPEYFRVSFSILWPPVLFILCIAYIMLG
jgi:hypothetical protein